MALLGQGAYGVPVDYSAWDNSAGLLGKALASGVSQIGAQIADIGEERKRNKEDVKSGKELAKAISTIYPQLEGKFDSYLAELDNEELPLSQRARLGSDIRDFIKIGIEKDRSDALMGVELDRLDLSRRAQDLDEQRFNLGALQASEEGQRENAKKLKEALATYGGVQDAAAASGGRVKLPEASGQMLAEAIQSGDGDAALAAATAAADAVKPFVGPKDLKMEEIAIQLPDGTPGVQQVWTDGSGQMWDIDGQALGDGVLPPPPGVGAITPPMSLPRGVRPTGTAKTPTEQALDEARLSEMQAQTKNREADLAKQSDAKATAKASAEDALKLIGDLRKHPGLNSAVGMTLTPSWLPATDRKGAEAIVNQLKGHAFLTAIQQLRGLGALSDAEGQKVQQAAARLDTNQSEADFKKSLDDFERQVNEALGRLGGAEKSPAASYSDRLKSLK